MSAIPCFYLAFSVVPAAMFADGIVTGSSYNITYRSKLYCYSTCACYSGLLLHQMEGRWQNQKGNWSELSVLLFLPQLSLHSLLTKHRMLGWLLHKMKKYLSVTAISLQKAEIGTLHLAAVLGWLWGTFFSFYPRWTLLFYEHSFEFG
jgi:hypothetical protein